jgi:hypothetical protein
VAQLGSALDWGSRGRRFKSCRPDWRQSQVRGRFRGDLKRSLDYSWGPLGDQFTLKGLWRTLTRSKCATDDRPVARIHGLTCDFLVRPGQMMAAGPVSWNGRRYTTSSNVTSRRLAAIDVWHRAGLALRQRVARMSMGLLTRANYGC